MVRLVDEEHDEIPARQSLAKGGVHMLATTVPALDETKLNIALNGLADFLTGNPMLAVYLLDYRIEPDDSSYLHRPLILPRPQAAVKATIRRKWAVLRVGGGTPVAAACISSGHALSFAQEGRRWYAEVVRFDGTMDRKGCGPGG